MEIKNNKENKENKENKNKINMPKFNLSWLYLIILVMICSLWFTSESGSSSRMVSYDEFQSYVEKGYVSKVVGYDDNTVEAYIKQENLSAVFKEDIDRAKRYPVVSSEAPSRESFGEFIQKERDASHFDGSVSYQ